MKSSEARTSRIAVLTIVSVLFWSAPFILFMINLTLSQWTLYITAAGYYAYLLVFALYYIVVFVMLMIMAVKARKQGVIVKSQYIIVLTMEAVGTAVLYLTPFVVPTASKIILGGAV